MPWSEGLAHWRDEETRTAFISVAFTWKLREVNEIARYYGALGYRVRAGGYGVNAVREKIKRGTHHLSGLVELGGDVPDAVVRQNPEATRASSGCEHVELLDLLNGLVGMVVLSGYPSELYESALSGWHKVSRLAHADGGGERTECLWINPAAMCGLEQVRLV